MTDFLQRLRERKLVQWALAYVAAAFALIQVVDIVAQRFGWPDSIERILIIAACVGFFVVLVLAWYHGERGAQKVSGTELAILALLLAIGGGFLWRFQATVPVAALPGKAADTAPATPPAPSRTAPDKSIAVLPFENLSSDKDNEYFASGMQDMVLTKLADIGELKVISRTSTEKYKSHPDNLKQIAQELGVRNILEGSVQKAGNQVLINVQLIDAATDEHIWAQAYTKTLDNIFGVEGEVAQMVAEALKAKLTPTQSQAVADVPTRDPQAYDDFLRGEHYANEAGKGAWNVQLPLAIAAYERAVAKDPAFALAWAEMSGVRTESRFHRVDLSDENLRAAEQNARRALELAPNLPEAHLAMGGVYRFLQHDLESARDEVKRALELRPNSPSAYIELGIMESHLGNYDAAVQAIERAVALDPQSSGPLYVLGVASMFVRDYAGARQAFRRELAIDPQSADAYARLSEIEILASGDIDAAAHVLDTMEPGTPPARSVASQRVALALYRRDFDAARKLAANLAHALGESELDTALRRADIEWVAGDKDQAHALYLAAVDKLRDRRSGDSETDHEDLALAYARLGRAADAIAENDEALAAYHRSKEVTGADMNLLNLAGIELALGHVPKAVDALAQILARPGTGYVSPALLRLDPTWDALRDDPRFKALLKKYEHHD